MAEFPLLYPSSYNQGLDAGNYEIILRWPTEDVLALQPPKEDVSVIVAGSLGRGEFTTGSDIDWSLLLDGAADHRHFALAADIRREVDRLSTKSVGREGTFGGMVVSHDLIHRIGGEADSNSNLTRRMLLLLETRPVGSAVAFDRTFTNVLRRYLLEDHSFWRGTTRLGHHVPHFLLNDLGRFWRTMAVDFAYKLRDREGTGGVIRSLKLRMSRKLLYAAGMLACYRCHLEDVFRLTPADIIASVLLRFDHLADCALRLFDSYSTFLEMLSDQETREHLERVQASGDPDSIVQRAMDASRTFGEALVELVFDEESGIGELTRRYGVF